MIGSHTEARGSEHSRNDHAISPIVRLTVTSNRSPVAGARVIVRLVIYATATVACFSFGRGLAASLALPLTTVIGWWITGVILSCLLMTAIYQAAKLEIAYRTTVIRLIGDILRFDCPTGAIWDIRLTNIVSLTIVRAPHRFLSPIARYLVIETAQGGVIHHFDSHIHRRFEAMRRLTESLAYNTVLADIFALDAYGIATRVAARGGLEQAAPANCTPPPLLIEHRWTRREQADWSGLFRESTLPRLLSAGMTCPYCRNAMPFPRLYGLASVVRCPNCESRLRVKHAGMLRSYTALPISILMTDLLLKAVGVGDVGICAAATLCVVLGGVLLAYQAWFVRFCVDGPRGTRCGACGYDLRECVAKRCPECGVTIAVS